MARAINQAEPEYRVVFAEEAVGQPAAQQGEKIHADDEGMEDMLGVAGPFGHRQEQQQRADQKWRQNIAHAIEAEALAAFIGDDVGDLPGHAPRPAW